jgi:hypothetical protein
MAACFASCNSCVHAVIRLAASLTIKFVLFVLHSCATAPAGEHAALQLAVVPAAMVVQYHQLYLHLQQVTLTHLTTFSSCALLHGSEAPHYTRTVAAHSSTHLAVVVKSSYTVLSRNLSLQQVPPSLQYVLTVACHY